MRKLIVAALAVLVIGSASGAFLWFQRPPLGEAVDFEVASGATTSAIAESLAEEEIIGSTLAFRVVARVRGIEGRIQSGRYQLFRGMGVQAAIDVLGRPPFEEALGLTVPEGFTLRQIADRVGERTHISAEDFERVTTDGTVRSTILPSGTTTLEGLLYPETYSVGERADAESLARRMVQEFESRIEDLDWSAVESRGLSRYDAIVIASLIEREARVPEDRELISSVIYNRLDIGMRLQIDITALYGLDEHKVPTRADLRRPSPHNTYLIDGLPPTPIANPGIESIRAALAPAETTHIFYVVIDPSGKHGFTDDPAEFERLKELRPPGVF
jgi:UPF0755 protein